MEDLIFTLALIVGAVGYKLLASAYRLKLYAGYEVGDRPTPLQLQKGIERYAVRLASQAAFLVVPLERGKCEGASAALGMSGKKLHEFLEAVKTGDKATRRAKEKELRAVCRHTRVAARRLPYLADRLHQWERAVGWWIADTNFHLPVLLRWANAAQEAQRSKEGGRT